MPTKKKKHHALPFQKKNKKKTRQILWMDFKIVPFFNDQELKFLFFITCMFLIFAFLLFRKMEVNADYLAENK